MKSRNNVLQARVDRMVRSANELSITQSEKGPMDLAKWGLLASSIKAMSEAFRAPPGPVLPSFPSSSSPPPQGHWASATSDFGSVWICHLHPPQGTPVHLSGWRQRQAICFFSETHHSPSHSLPSSPHTTPLSLAGLQPQRPAFPPTHQPHTILGALVRLSPVPQISARLAPSPTTKVTFTASSFLSSLKLNTPFTTFTLHLLFLLYFSP